MTERSNLSLVGTGTTDQEVAREAVEEFLAELISQLPTDRKALRKATWRSHKCQIAHVREVLGGEKGFMLACAMHVPYSRCQQCSHIAL